MSDCAGSRYGKKEDFQILLTDNDPVESPQHKNYLWMERWTKASSSAEPQNDKSCNRLEDVNKGTNTKYSGTSPFEVMKSTVGERLMVGVSRGGASVQHTRDVCKELGPKNSGRGDESVESRMQQKAVNLHARAVVSETYCVRKLSGLPLDFQKLGSSDYPGSDWSHFPMFKINRKIDNILNPKRRLAHSHASQNVNMSTSHVMALSAQEYMMHSHQIADENMDTCKPAAGIVSHLEDPTGLGSDPSTQKLKGHLSDTMSCSCSKDNNDSSDCQIDDQHELPCENSKHEQPCASVGKKFKFAGNNKNQIAVSAFHNQKSRKSAVHKQQDSAGVIFYAPVLGTEFQKEPINRSNNSKRDCEIFHGTSKSRSKAVSSSSLLYEQQHLKTERMKSAANLNDSYMLPAVANALTANSKQLAHGKESTEKSTASCKRKGPCLFETLTIPSKSQSAYHKNSVSSGKSSDLGLCMYGTNIGSRLFGGQNHSSSKTETLLSDILIVSNSRAGSASSPTQKEYSCPKEAKTEQLATPLARGSLGYIKENGSCNVNDNHDVSSRTTIASKQSCIPRTGTTNLDIILFQISRMRNPISSCMVQPAIGSEPSDRWLKRLQFDISDPNIPGSKRQKVGDSSPLGQTSSLFGMALHCNRSDNEEMIDRAKEDMVLDDGSKVQDNQETSRVPAKSMNCWIGRWCQGGTPVFRRDPGQGRQAAKPDQASEELGGPFPSIAAMAMMGRAMNKLRPCEHQKKGPFVVWKTD